jgi:DNA-binding response OmpR family regulator
VDDEQLVAGFISTSLRRANYQVTTFLDPREAVEEFRKDPRRYVALVTDLTMPHL